MNIRNAMLMLIEANIVLFKCILNSDNRRSSPGVDSRATVVKRTRVPAGSLVKMATDVDVDSGRKRTLIQPVEAYT